LAFFPALQTWPTHKMKHIFEIAMGVITGARQKDYGKPEENFSDIATGWTVIAKRAIETDGGITPAHVALMNDWQKTCRLLKTPAHEDSWVDKAGYTAIGYELSKDVKSDESDILRFDMLWQNLETESGKKND